MARSPSAQSNHWLMVNGRRTVNGRVVVMHKTFRRVLGMPLPPQRAPKPLGLRLITVNGHWRGIEFALPRK